MGMIKDAQDLYCAVTVDGTPEQRAYLLRVAFRVVVLVHMLWACNLLLPLGFTGFARADDVDSKIASAVGPLHEQLADVKKKQTETESKVDTILRLQIESRLRALQAELCDENTTRALRQTLEQEMDSLQDEHRSQTGAYYPLPACRIATRGPPE